MWAHLTKLLLPLLISVMRYASLNDLLGLVQFRSIAPSLNDRVQAIMCSKLAQTDLFFLAQLQYTWVCDVVC